jgi:hypothetical protein
MAAGALMWMFMARGGEAAAQQASRGEAPVPPAGAMASPGTATPLTVSISLEEALARAARRPLVGMAEERLEEARGAVQQAALPAYNPELSAAAGPRWVEIGRASCRERVS